jgi:hypothetical protein
MWEAEQGRVHAGHFCPVCGVSNPRFPIYEATSRTAHDKLRDINSSFHIRNNIWGRFGWLGIDCQLPPEVPTQIGVLIIELW